MGQLQGIGKITGEVKARTLTVEHEPATATVEAIQGAVRRTGYESTILSGPSG